MLDLFTLLGGGIYNGIRYAKDRRKSQEYEVKKLNRDLALINLSMYEANYELVSWAKDFIASGAHYDEICEWFADDFKYVFGSDWKAKLSIPQPFRPLRYGKSSYPWHMSSAHVMWVYHLLLAQKGKIECWVISRGLPIGGINEKDMNIKFAERIEKRLIDAGVKDVRFALAFDKWNGTAYCAPVNCYGGNIVIESVSTYPTRRLW